MKEADRFLLARSKGVLLSHSEKNPEESYLFDRLRFRDVEKKELALSVM